MRTLVILLCLATASLPATAQDDYTLLGAGVRSRPEFDGSRDRTIDLVPVVRYYGKPWFARSTQGILEGGARAPLGGGLVGGVQLAYEQGPRDTDPGASLGFHLEWDSKLGEAPVTLLGRLRHHLDSDRGDQLDLRATVGVHQSSRALAGVFAQVTFANTEYTRAYYGQSESGQLYTDFGLLGSYDMTKAWVLVGSLHARRLNGDIQGVQKKTGTYASAGVAYKF